MRILHLSVLMLLAAPAAAQTALPGDADTACAATFTMLSANARAAGYATGSLDAVARAAQGAHLRRHPREDATRYFAAVRDTAAQLRGAMSDGRLPFPSVQAQLVNCHARYGTNRQMVAVAY